MFLFQATDVLECHLHLEGEVGVFLNTWHGKNLNIQSAILQCQNYFLYLLIRRTNLIKNNILPLDR